MSFSFCIITGGTRPDTLRIVITSIRAQEIPRYELIIVGKHFHEPGIIYVAAEDAAAQGKLSVLRNQAVARANYENIVILDDDIILSPDWYKYFLAYEKPFEILTSQVRVPDGGRYLDHATVGGPRGNIILKEDEEDDYVYMTGGGGWIMKNFVAKNVQWDENRAYYEEEDVDFSRKCQAQGYKIAHNHRMVVFHADPTYTCIGRVIARRKDGRSHEWIQQVFTKPSTIEILHRIIYFRKMRCYAEAADYVRMAKLKGPLRCLFKVLWRIIETKMGGRLPEVCWYPTGDPTYLDALKRYNAKL